MNIRTRARRIEITLRAGFAPYIETTIEIGTWLIEWLFDLLG